MSDVYDLYAPDFPHGSAAGFEKGCRSSAVCTNYGSTEWLTCREARQQRMSDYNTGRLPIDQPVPREQPTEPAKAKPKAKRIDAEMPPLGVPGGHNPKDQVLGVNAPGKTAKDDHDAGATAPVVPAPGTPKTSTSDVNARTDTTAKDDHEAESLQPAVPAPDVDPLFIARGHGGIVVLHGTAAGYGRGCRDDKCPAIAITGISCKKAKNEYFRNYQAKKRQAASSPDATPDAADETSEAENTTPAATIGPEQGTEVLEADIPPIESDTDQIADPDIHITDDHDAINAAQRDLVNSERAAREIAAAAREERLEMQTTFRTLSGQLETATATISDRDETIALLERDKASQAREIHRLEQQYDELVVARDVEQLRKELATIPTQPPTAPGGDTALTLTPTDNGLEIGFSTDAGIEVRIALSGSGQHGLGDVAISVRS